MLPFNEEFRTGESKITQIRLSVLLKSGTLLSLTEEHVLLGGFSRDSSTTVDGAFTIGAAVTGKITVSIDNSSNTFSIYDFRGAVITASLGGILSDGTGQLVQVGIYTVDEYTYDGCNITLTAYDNLQKFDLPCQNTTVTFPRTIKQLIDQACSVAGVTLANTSIPNGGFSITKKPAQWETMTWHDVLAYCAQMACCFVKVLPDGRLYYSWYLDSVFNTVTLDGGTFDTNTTPYSDGDTASGGDFTYTDTEILDGGTFGDRDDYHVLGSIFDMSVDTDDVLITGVSVVLDPTNNIDANENTTEYVKTLGNAGYVIRIENNPLIETTTAANSVCQYLYNYIVGMRFRPLSSSILENPSVEAGDVALLVDRYNNTHRCFLSHVVYMTGAATTVTCDAESSKQNLRYRYTEGEKTRALAHRTYEIAITNAESAMQTIMSAVATTMGLYKFEEHDGQGGTIYTFGNNRSLPQSQIRWRFSAGALMVSSDYGAHWNGALTASGVAVLQQVYAVKVNADNIVAGTISGRAISGGSITGSNVTIGGSNANGYLKILDSNNQEVVYIDKGIARFKGTITGGSVLGGTLSGGEIVGTSITLGGKNNGNGSATIQDNNGTTCGTIDNTGLTAMGSYISYNASTGNASKINSGRQYFFDSNTPYTYEQLKNLSWNEANGVLGVANGLPASANLKGFTVLSRKDFVAVGQATSSGGYTTCYVANITKKYNGYSEKNILNGDTRVVGSLNTNRNINLYNPAPDKTTPIRWCFSSDPSKYAFIGYFEQNNVFNLRSDYSGSPANLYVGNLNAHGTKNRVVTTKHYGDVGLSAFETPSPYFADIGSGTIGEDGKVTIFFDPVFEETIETKAEYQVFLTRTSEAQTEWVDKQNGFFIVHGEPGATFDWMVTCHQRDYAASRLETIESPEPLANNDPIVEEDTSAIDAVNEMIEQYNEQLEGIA